MGAAALPLLIAASVAASGAAAYSQYSTAKSQAAFQQYSMAVQNQQLEQDKKNSEIQAISQENLRLQAAREQMSTNRATLAAFGLGENQSFLMGATAADQRALRNTVADTRLGLATNLSRLSDQIGVNTYSASNAGYGARMAGINAIGGFVGSAAQAGMYYNRYNTPSLDIGTLRGR
jgi:hypothetical protein